MYDFKLPIKGIAIKWKPLDVGQQLSLSASYQGAQAVYFQAAAMADRIIQYGDKTKMTNGGMSPCSRAEIDSWDEIDYTLFSEEVERVEAERMLAYKKKENGADAVAKAQASVAVAVESLMAAIKALNECMGEVKKAQQAVSAGPLNAG